MTANDPNLDKSGIQKDNSDEPVVNIKLPGAHFMSGGSVSVLAQHATWTTKMFQEGLSGSSTTKPWRLDKKD